MNARLIAIPFAVNFAFLTLSSSALAQPGPTFFEVTSPLFFPLTPSDVPPLWTYEWQVVLNGADPADARYVLLSTSNFGDSYQVALAYLNSTENAPEWSAWAPYVAVGTSWTSPAMAYGNYVFAVQGRDQQGTAELIDIGRNARFIKIAPRDTGPLLSVDGELINLIVTSVTSTPVTEVHLPAGYPVMFCWTAEAEFYGGVVTGYRYGWDIADPDDDAQWEMEFTPFSAPQICSAPTTAPSGIHMFYIEVIDNSGYKSRVPILLDTTPGTSTRATTWGQVKSLYTGHR
ncbi:MAG TPA: hypothetical protein VFU38_10575 [Candidatus Krumholzibacteria bacterium]|nr:hypothetical protein [Candidatus Krumholzibacteria bacterium]